MTLTRSKVGQGVTSACGYCSWSDAIPSLASRGHGQQSFGLPTFGMHWLPQAYCGSWVGHRSSRSLAVFWKLSLRGGGGWRWRLWSWLLVPDSLSFHVIPIPALLNVKPALWCLQPRGLCFCKGIRQYLSHTCVGSEMGCGVLILHCQDFGSFPITIIPFPGLSM